MERSPRMNRLSFVNNKETKVDRMSTCGGVII